MRTTNSKLRAAPAPPPAPPNSIARLRPEEASLCKEMVSAFYRSMHIGRRSTKRHAQLVVARVWEFIEYSGLPPWRCDEECFLNWCEHLVTDRNATLKTEQRYQTAIKIFYDFLLGPTVKFRNSVRLDFGHEIRQICHRDNMIPHRHGTDEPTTFRFTGSDLRKLFSSLDSRLAELLDPRWPFDARVFAALARDRALYFIMLVGALRISEALSIRLHSFESLATMPSLGDFASVRVTGKGNKPRLVPLDNPQLPEVLQTYLDVIRPYFARRGSELEDAFFLGWHGGTISVQNCWKRLKQNLELAGVDSRLFATHAFRRTGITADQVAYGDIMMVRDKAGHAGVGTTQRYTRFSDGYVGNILKETLEARTNALGMNKSARSKKE